MELRVPRKAKGLTQQAAARLLGVSQGYLSLLETGQRRASARLCARLAEVLDLPPTAVPPSAASVASKREELPADLSALGYPGFHYLQQWNLDKKNPASVLLGALTQEHLDSRVAAALPWVVYQFPDLDWDWLVPAVKARDAQNRLGFLVTLGRELAEQNARLSAADKLRQVESSLEGSRLVREDVFGRPNLTQAERRWLDTNRPPEAKRWNVLSNLKVEHLQHVS
jgi:transcriptional regulator with XRE-family HTH domain